jgi:hypothetical protein
MKPTLHDLAEDIHEATGYEGETLQAATYVAAMVLADLVGRRDIGNYFAARAEGCRPEKIALPATSAPRR